jgi:DNA-binding transcriptional regulator YdaS (Cro superfamily)
MTAKKTRRAAGAYYDRPAASLEEAVERTVTGVGGNAAAAALTGVSKTQIQRYSDPAEGHSEITVRRAMTLEKVTRAEGAVPAVLAWYAAELRYALLDLGAADPDDDWSRDLAALSKEIAEFFAAFHQAMADGRIEASEAGRVLGELRDVWPKLAALQARLVDIRDGGDADRRGGGEG